MSPIETERLLVRRPVESDRRRFVELFTDEGFMVFAGVHDAHSADARFDLMLALADLIPYAKQPVIERASGNLVGYTGVASIVYGGIDRLEWGWRLVPEARRLGYATEATTALLSVADSVDDGEMLCLVAVENVASLGVARKVGFRPWKTIDWDGDPAARTELLTRQIGTGGPPLCAPEL